MVFKQNWLNRIWVQFVVKETCFHKTRTKSSEILEGFYTCSGCFKNYDQLVPSPVGDTQLYHPLGMGLGDTKLLERPENV